MNVAYSYPSLAETDKPAYTAGRFATNRVARIEIVNDLAAAETPWAALAAQDPITTPYQRHGWIALWQKHVGAIEGMRPFVVIGYDAESRPLFVLPFGREKIGPITIARFFGGKHATINLGVWRQDFAETVTSREMQDIVTRISGHGIDLLMLFTQPETWKGLRNPLQLLPHQPSSGDNFRLTLGSSGAQTIKRQISATMRGRLRTKERKLEKLKNYRYLRATKPEDVNRLLDAFFLQKATRLERQGIENVFARAGIEPFIRAACRQGLDEGRPLIELHALEADGDMLALFSGVVDRYRFTAMFNSYTLSSNARWSPGLILLMHLVESCADRGIQTFDVGPGEARYKTFFCKDREPFFDSFIGLTARGRALAVGVRALYGMKRAIKSSPVIWDTVQTVRQKLARPQ